MALAPVHRNAARCLAGRQRPTVAHLQRLRVECDDLTCAHYGGVNHALFVGHGELGPAAELDRADHLVRLSIDRRRVHAAGVEGEDTFRGRVVDDGVRRGADFGPGRFVQRLQVEDRHGRVAAVAGVALFLPRGDGDAVDTGGVLYFADDLPLIDVHDNDAVGAREKEPPARGVHREIIPAALAADLDRAEQMVARLRLGSAAGPQDEENQRRQRDDTHSCHERAFQARRAREGMGA